MAKGKFSGPRPYREEERQIEEAFRQVAGQPTRRPAGAEYTPVFPPEDSTAMPELEREPEQPGEAAENPQPPVEESAPELPEFPEPEDGPWELPPEEAPDEETDGEEAPLLRLLNRVLEFVDKNRKMVMVGACAGTLLVLLCFISAFFMGTGSDPYKGKILNNVFLAGVNVGGMTKAEAIEAVKTAVGDAYTSQSMTVRLGGTTLTLDPKDTGAKLDAKAAVTEAYQYGRTGTKEEKQAAYEASFTSNHTIGLLPYLNLDEKYIRGVLENYSKSVGSILTQPSCALEGQVPELDTDVFDPETAPALTLVITMGTPGVNFQTDKLLEEILDAYSLGIFQVAWDDNDPDALPEPPDLAVIQKEFSLEPVDDSIDLKTYETIPGSYGYTFDLKEAEKRLEGAQYGQMIRVPLAYVAPEHMGEAVLYQDVLGQCRTPYSDSGSRLNNLRLACKALDGQLLKPGQTFSFKDCLGKPTEEAGYEIAASYTGMEKVNTLGGGISQVASTLYYAGLYADLEAVERQAHSLVMAYIDMGMDAAVSWNGADLKLKNNGNFPVKLQAVAENGYVTVQVLGTEERDYYVEMSYSVDGVYEPKTEYVDYPGDNDEGYEDGDVLTSGTTGYLVRTYRNKYNRQTNKLMGSDYVTYSRYQTVDKKVVRVLPEETEPPTEEETVPPETTAPTQPPTEATEGATEPPATEAPTEPPTTEATTEATEAATEAVTEAATDPATEATQAAVEATTAPTQQEAPSGDEPSE